MAEVDKAKFSGVNIINLPKDITIKDLQTLLEEKGLPFGHESISLIKYKRSTGADIEGLTAEVCIKLTVTVNEQFEDAFDRKLFCSGMSDLASEDPSPSKPLCAPVLNIDNDVLEPFNIPGLPAADLAKSVKNTLKKGRKVTAVQAPGSGKNSRTGLDVSEGKEISASADGGHRSRVCARETLRSGPHQH